MTGPELEHLILQELGRVNASMGRIEERLNGVAGQLTARIDGLADRINRTDQRVELSGQFVLKTASDGEVKGRDRLYAIIFALVMFLLTATVGGAAYSLSRVSPPQKASQ